MAGADDSGDDARARAGQDPFVERLRPDPAEPPTPSVELAGLLGDSDRPGYRRVYFTRALDQFAEFRSDDVLHTEPIPKEQAPFQGLDATRVTLRRGAPVDYTHTRVAGAVDEFDVDVRLGQPSAMQPVIGMQAETWEAECPGPSFFAPCQTDFTCICGDTIQITICRGATCIDVCTDVTCRTDCNQATCATCRTQCGQATCAPTCRTCATQCQQATCITCQTACGQATCQTCRTRCGQPTCRTCETLCGGTCNPHVFTCGPNPQCLPF
jgi:hypothetical protein